MPDLHITKERFLALFAQFKGDYLFELEILRSLLSDLPPHFMKPLIEPLFFEQIFSGSYYMASHITFTTTVHYFFTLDSLYKFLNDSNLGTAYVSMSKISACLKDQTQSLCGYTLKEVNKYETKSI